ncbi:hypothetical protein QA612_13600 [Evansella sp. AB-P1]|nr:hypothetical protein [Evansella sp. AB-P1]MDG5788517.1 hypothetical protein [Evansella sp. AB-P1]
MKKTYEEWKKELDEENRRSETRMSDKFSYTQKGEIIVKPPKEKDKQ